MYRCIKICKSTINKLCTVVLTSLFVCSQMYGCVFLDHIAFILDVFWGGSVSIYTNLQVILLFSCVELLYAGGLLTGHHVCSTVCSMCMKIKLLRKDKIKFLDIVGVISWLWPNHFHLPIRLINNAVTHDKVYYIFFTIKQHEGIYIHWNVKKKVWFPISDDTWNFPGM